MYFVVIISEIVRERDVTTKHTKHTKREEAWESQAALLYKN